MGCAGVRWGDGEGKRSNADGWKGAVNEVSRLLCAVAFGSLTPHPAPPSSPQLQEAFGWDPFIQLFAEYQTLSDIPQDNAGKMNLWVKKFSGKVQRNLAPFFKAWGWPVQEEVAESLAGLPPWEGNPLRVYVH